MDIIVKNFDQIDDEYPTQSDSDIDFLMEFDNDICIYSKLFDVVIDKILSGSKADKNILVNKILYILSQMVSKL